MSEKSKACGADNAQAPEEVRFDQQNISETTENTSDAQSIIRYKLDSQLWVVAVHRNGARHV